MFAQNWSKVRNQSDTQSLGNPDLWSWSASLTKQTYGDKVHSSYKTRIRWVCIRERQTRQNDLWKWTYPRMRFSVVPWPDLSGLSETVPSISILLRSVRKNHSWVSDVMMYPWWLLFWPLHSAPERPLNKVFLNILSSLACVVCVVFDIQLTPTLTDFNGTTIFICYRQMSVIANKENK